MSDFDKEFLDKLGLSKRELGEYLRVTPQSVGQGIQANKRYFDTQRLALIYVGLESSGQIDKLRLVEESVEEVEAFNMAVEVSRVQSGPLGKMTGKLQGDYVWILKNPERINEEFELLSTFLDIPHRLIVATQRHNIPTASHDHAVRVMLETRYLANLGDRESYCETPGHIDLVATELGLLTPELMLPNVSEYAGQPGFVTTRDGFNELPSDMVKDMVFTVQMEFCLAQSKEQNTLIRGVPIQLTWSSRSLPYAKALKLFMTNNVVLPTDKLDTLWRALNDPACYQGSSVNWSAVETRLDIPVGNEPAISAHTDKRFELKSALFRWADAMKIDKTDLENRIQHAMRD